MGPWAAAMALTMGSWLAGSAGSADVPPPLPELSSTRTQGVLALAAGTALGITSAVAFTTGLDIERDLRSQRRSEAELDELLNARTVAGAIAWPALALAAAGVSTGVFLLNVDDAAGGAP